MNRYTKEILEDEDVVAAIRESAFRIGESLIIALQNVGPEAISHVRSAIHNNVALATDPKDLPTEQRDIYFEQFMLPAMTEGMRHGFELPPRPYVKPQEAERTV